MLVGKAMEKYQTFEKEIIEYCSKEDVDEREQFYIQFFDSMNMQRGYNLTSGGSSNKILAESVRKTISEKRKGSTMPPEIREKISKAVIQIDPKTLNAIERFPSIMEAARATGADYSTISSVCCRKSSTAKGYYWCFEDDYDDDYIPREIGWRGHVYSDEERLVISKRYSGAGNPMYGTHRFGGENPHALEILQYDLNANYLARYDCAKTAAIALNKMSAYSTICRAAKGQIKSACGYIWRYANSDLPVTPYVKGTTKGFKHSEESKAKMAAARLGKIGGPQAKPVLQYDLDGNFIKEYVSANNAEVSLNMKHGSVLQACTGKKKTSYGYVWRLKLDDNYPLKIEPTRVEKGKPVDQLDLDGRLIKVWANAAEAAAALKISAAGITGCCRGYPKYHTAGKYRWRYHSTDE